MKDNDIKITYIKFSKDNILIYFHSAKRNILHKVERWRRLGYN